MFWTVADVIWGILSSFEEKIFFSIFIIFWIFFAYLGSEIFVKIDQVLSKKNLVNFHKNLWPRICKKIQKIHENRKNSFFLKKNSKYLSLIQQHHLRCFRQVSGQNLSKKNLVNFHKQSLTPDMEKNSKKSWNSEKIIFSSKKLKNTLVYVSNTIWDVLDKFQVKKSQ